MGKKNGNNQKKPEPSRRDFLKWGLLGALGLAASGGSFCYISRNVFDGSSDLRDDWSFLNSQAGITKDELQEIKLTVPIGPSSQIDNNTKRFDSIKECLLREAQRRGLTGNYYFKTFQQMYGQPDHPEFTESLLVYCKKAHDFLYQNLAGLKKFNLDWTILNYGDNYQKNFEQRVFLANGYCEVLDHFVHDEKTGQLLFPYSTSRTASITNKARVEYKNKDSNEMLWFYICLQTGKSALKAPLSEIIPLSMAEKHREYIRKVGSDLADIAVEAASEAAAFILSKELARELNIPGGIDIISKNHLSGLPSNPRYQQVSNAVKWMEKNSVQAGYNLYMEDPEKFMQAIKS